MLITLGTMLLELRDRKECLYPRTHMDAVSQYSVECYGDNTPHSDI